MSRRLKVITIFRYIRGGDTLWIWTAVFKLWAPSVFIRILGQNGPLRDNWVGVTIWSKWDQPFSKYEYVLSPYSSVFWAMTGSLRDSYKVWVRGLKVITIVKYLKDGNTLSFLRNRTIRFQTVGSLRINPHFCGLEPASLLYLSAC